MKSKGAGNVPNKTMYSRVSYLYQAATFLATQQQPHSKAEANSLTDRGSSTQVCDATYTAKAEMQAHSNSETTLQPASRRLISDLRAVSLKTQMRMSPAMKHAICKNCDTLLIDGSTCTSEVENQSKGGKKQWADILVRRCKTCGLARRYPVAAERQKRRPQRSPRESTPEIRVVGG
jgi:ribonuclease P protein subunit RPR2